ncbi:helix-turn-helix domain-containing protein [Bacillus toyonensis]|uniref:helix-turn-helix domain-containing protein n=1 Tax=Bacillus toyonensis TaxID=155322 RepID=UPI000BF0B9DE|nr:helix-turn-helix domain-containing protein [Bacillus toyonensis]PEM64408.1 hypothetical protein CN625_01470 [Bacillus toyonensis]
MSDVKTINEVTTGETLEKGGYFVAYNLVMRNVMKVYDLSPGEFSCLTMLFSYAGADKDKCFPGQEKLASDLNTSKRTVMRYLEGLETKGVIVTYNRFNKDKMKTKNIYDLSPCLDKIRELYAPKDDEEFVLVRKEKRNSGGDKSVTTEETTNERDEIQKVPSEVDSVEVTNLSLPKNETRQECHPTNNKNNKQLKPLNNIKIDDYKANSVTPPKESSESIELVIKSVREQTKDLIITRSFNTVVGRVMAKYVNGDIKIGFREYLVGAVYNHIEQLDKRRTEQQAKESLARTSQSGASDEYTGNILLYNFLDQSEGDKPLKK